jgi:hypothetical protein
MKETDQCTYTIRLRGKVDEREISASGPLEVCAVHAGRNSTRITCCTDQSGLVGLLRHLHGQGYVFLSIVRKP